MPPRKKKSLPCNKKSLTISGKAFYRPQKKRQRMLFPFLTPSLMKKSLLILITVLLTATTTYARPQAKEHASDIYGWIRYDEVNRDNYGICRFNSNTPEQIDVLFPFDALTQACAGASANGKYYVYRYTPGDLASPLDFGTVNLNTGEFSAIANYQGLNTLFSDMTYDYSTSTMYAIGNPNGGNTTVLMSVDLNTGNIKQVGSLGDKFCTLACSIDGQLYAIKGNDGFLHTVDKTSGKTTEVGYTWEEPEAAYFQSMEFDHNTETLYWSGNNIYQEGFLATIDLASGEATRLGYLGNNAQVVGLHIPYEATDENAPAAVTALTGVPAADGSASATLTWTNPSKTAGGQSLANITRIDIYRDEALAGSVTGAAGQPSSWTDTNAGPAGLKTYRVQAVNEAGKGKSAEHTLFVGFDIPAAPTDAKASKTGEQEITVTWTAPYKGQSGGVIDSENITYKVTRMPDKAVFENIREQRMVDSTISSLNSYSYKIEASTTPGIFGAATVSNPVTAGSPIDLPYTCDFGTEEEFAVWVVDDANKDSFTWKRETTLNAAYYSYNEDGVTGGDDWLISPPFNLKKGKSYRLRFKLQSYDSSYEEKMDIYFGQGSEKEALTTKLGDYTIANHLFQEFETTLPPVSDDGAYNLGFRCHSEPYKFILYLTDIVIEEVTGGSVSLKVTDGLKPLPNVTATIKETKETATSGADGIITFDNVETGKYTVSLSAPGYADYEFPMEIAPGITFKKDIAMTVLQTIAVTGSVCNEEGIALDGANVSVEAYSKHSIRTASDGKFSFNDVKVANDAQLVISRYGMQDFRKPINATSETVDLGKITMTDKLIAPSYAKASATDMESEIAWEKPMDTKEYKYDSGIFDGRLGRPDDTDKSVYGSVFRTPAVITAIDWMTDKYLLDHKTVNLFIFDLDTHGEPTSKILYAATGVPTVNNEWSHHELPSPITAPHGYMLAVSCNGQSTLALAKADGTEYPFVEKRHCFAADYTSGQFTYIENHSIDRPLMLRAKGFSIDDRSLSASSTLKYKVWRLLDSDILNPSLWKEVETATSARQYTDKEWPAITQGIYRYAVATVYADGEVSEPAITNTLANKMTTKVEVNVTTNTPENEAEGADVTLTNSDGDNTHVYKTTVGTDGKATFENVWKGAYSVEIFRHGYEPSVQKSVDLSEAATYSLNYSLKEYVVAPFNLEIRTTDTLGQRIFAWNQTPGFSDDFEGHADFAVNSPGTAGWDYIDGDKDEVYPIDGVDYPNATSPMAFMVFNPFETDPVLGVVNQDIKPHSGRKFLADFATPQNNDFIISPPLDFAKDFTFKFFAKSCNEDYGKEKMNVGYSVSGKTPDDFVWLNGETPVELPMGDWKEYRYTIPAKAKYVTINCVSDYLFLMMVDDIFIGIEAPDGVNPEDIRKDLKFEVYLDGKKTGATSEKSFTFDNLQNGTHKAGVKALFASQTTPLVETEFTVTDGSGIEETATANVRVMPNPTSGFLKIEGTHETVEIVSATGLTVARFGSEKTIDISPLPDGVYFVKVTAGECAKIERIILAK